MTLVEAFARYVERSLSRHPMRSRVRIAVSSDEYHAIEDDMRARGYAFTDSVVSGVRLAIESGRRNEDLLVEIGEHRQALPVVSVKSPDIYVVKPDTGHFVENLQASSVSGFPPEELQEALVEAVEDLKENAEDLFEAPAPAPEPRKRGRRG